METRRLGILPVTVTLAAIAALILSACAQSATAVVVKPPVITSGHHHGSTAGKSRHISSNGTHSGHPRSQGTKHDHSGSGHQSTQSAKGRHDKQNRHKTSHRKIVKHPVPPLKFSGKRYFVGDLFGIGAYAANRYPGLASPALSRARQTGADWVREEFTANNLHLATKARYQWWRTDPVVKTERRLGFHILGLLDYSNTFQRHKTNSWMPHWDLQRHINDFVAYVQAIVHRYKNDIDAWQIWNEPDLDHFWRPKINAADYARLLRASYRAIKKIEPKAIVVMGGPAGSDPHGVEYVHRVVRAGGLFDVVSIQPYRDVPDLSLLTEVKKLQQYHRPVWFTEMGWAGDQACWTTCGDPVSQADRLARLYAVAAFGHVQRVFWYDLRDDGTGPSFEDHFGLLEPDLQAKPAYLAYEISHNYLSNAEMLGVDTLGPQIFAFSLRKDGKRYVVLWNNELGPYGLRIPWSTSAQADVLNWAGESLGVSSKGELDVVVPARSVVYVVPTDFLPPSAEPPGISLAGKRIQNPRLNWPGSSSTARKPKKPRHKRHHHHHHPPKPTATPKPTPKPTPTRRPTPTPTPTRRPRPTPTPTRRPTPTPTVKPTPTSTPVPSPTKGPPATPTATKS